MKTQKKDIDIIFNFNGLWDLPSKCGLKIYYKLNSTIVIVTELYKENPGTSITDVSASLAMQICEKYNIDLSEIVYIESSPESNSKLSFYREKNYKVNFEIDGDKLINPTYKELSKDDLLNIL